jgi:hypothetical protein
VDFDAAADELFVLAPGAFIERRNALAAVARSEGDDEAAATIKALRRPTVSAALVNALVRERGEVIASFLALGDELRDAQASGDGQQVRTLVGRRQELMRDLDRHVDELASERGLTATRAVQQEVHATMFAALSNLSAEAAVRGGRLESALNAGDFPDSPPAASERPKAASQTESEAARALLARRIAAAEQKLNEANASAAAADEEVEKLSAAVTSAQRELADAVRRAATLREAAAKAKTAYEHCVDTA